MRIPGVGCRCGVSDLAASAMGIVHGFCYQLSKSLARAALDHQVVGREHLFEDGPALICSNHVSFLDPPLVGTSFDKPIYYLARKSLYSNPFARWLFPKLNVVPVDQDRAGFAGLKTAIRMLQDGKRVIIFPEGSRSPDGQLQPAQPGPGLVVAKARVPVIPVRIFGAYEALPYGSMKFRMSTVTVVAGPVLRFDREQLPDTKEGYLAISERIMAAIAEIRCPEDRIPEPRKERG